jgi:hypothetical protein
MKGVMSVTAATSTDVMGQAQVMMLRRQLDVEVSQNARLMESMPPPPPVPETGTGGHVDIRV